MKKLVKILAAMTVAVATLAFVSCADGFANADGTAYTPPAAPVAPTGGTYTLDYAATNTDYAEVVAMAPATVVKVVSAGATANTYIISYTINFGNGAATKTARQWKFEENVTVEEGTGTITVTKNGESFTYKAPAAASSGSGSSGSGSGESGSGGSTPAAVVENFNLTSVTDGETQATSGTAYDTAVTTFGDVKRKGTTYYIQKITCNDPDDGVAQDDEYMSADDLSSAGLTVTDNGNTITVSGYGVEALFTKVNS